MRDLFFFEMSHYPSFFKITVSWQILTLWTIGSFLRIFLRLKMRDIWDIRARLFDKPRLIWQTNRKTKYWGSIFPPQKR